MPHSNPYFISINTVFAQTALKKSLYIKLINADGVSDFTHKNVFLDENRAVCVVEYLFVNNTGLYKI